MYLINGDKIQIVAARKTVFISAIYTGVITTFMNLKWKIAFNVQNTIDQNSIPNKSFSKQIRAVRLPFLFVPIADIKTGHAAPTPIPITIGSATAKLIPPVTDSACKIPTDADALCKTAVKRIPTKIPAAGFVNIVSMLLNVSLSLSGATAPLIVCIPNIKIAKPSIISPTWRQLSFFITIRKTIPIMATTAEIVAVERSCAMPPDPSIQDRQRIQPVTLVPIFAPMIIPIDCATFIIPEFTNPTTITVVADED